MGGELDERPKQGLVTQTVSKIVMSFAKQVGVLYSIVVGEAIRGGERTHVFHAVVVRPLTI